MAKHTECILKILVDALIAVLHFYCFLSSLSFNSRDYSLFLSFSLIFKFSELVVVPSLLLSIPLACFLSFINFLHYHHLSFSLVTVSNRRVRETSSESDQF